MKWSKKFEIRKTKKMYPDNGSKNTHIKFHKDQSTGTFSKIEGTERLEEIIP